MDPQSNRILNFLSLPANYPHHPRNIRRLQTHASWVFIAPPFVYKIKQPVNLGFLNFTSLESRRINSESEVRLNRRLAENVYLGVLAICSNGTELHFETPPSNIPAPPNVLEWVVQMRQLPENGFLLHKLHTGTATDHDIHRVIDRLLTFYHTQPPLTGSPAAAATDRMHKHIEDNFQTARSIPESILPPHRLAFLQTGTAAFESRHRSLLQHRPSHGWIRDCHGDLHLEHIHLSDEQVQIYDCLEFDDGLRQIDIACDIAFLAMDLDFHQRSDWSHLLIQRLTHELPDPEMPLLMRWYQTYRACVRGKVEYLRSISETATTQERADAADNARRYFQLAARYLFAGNKPRILTFAGQSASGKSLLAEFAATETGWPLLSSDQIRKTLAGVPLFHRVSATERTALYSAQMTEAVYTAIQNKAAELLNAGHSVILDATFSDQAQRAALMKFAAGIDAELIWTIAEAPEDIRRERLRCRAHQTDVVSDAREEDLPLLSSRFQPPTELPSQDCIHVDTSSSPALSKSCWLQQIASRQS
ncbi:MAG: hypothetical protein RLZZ458_1347 [Planctomycetota bacterium]